MTTTYLVILRGVEICATTDKDDAERCMRDLDREMRFAGLDFRPQLVEIVGEETT